MMRSPRFFGRCPALAWLLVLPLVLMSPRASADGKVFSVAAAPATIPDQQALICFKDGVETLAIETRFEGEGKEFAWVVPLPAVPEISQATRGLFPTLRAMFLPRVGRVDGVVLLAPMLLVCVLAVGVFMPRWSAARIVLYAACTLMLICAGLPSLGVARSSAGADGPVTVLDRRIVGSFETQVLTAKDPAELAAWLSAGGFALPEKAVPVLGEYIARGWVFAASKLRRDEASRGMMTPHPLVFRFAASRAVYPMRLTMTQDVPVDLELYVFGDAVATASGLATEFGASTRYEPDDAERASGDAFSRWYRRWYPRFPDEVVVGHDAVDRFTRPARFGTKLVGTVRPGAAAEDIEIRWDGEAMPRPVRYTDASAWIMGGATACWSVIVALLVGAIQRQLKLPMSAALCSAGWGLLTGAIACAVVAAMVPTTPISPRSGGVNIDGVAWEVSDRAVQRQKRGELVDLEWIRAAFGEVCRERAQRGELDRIPIEEDSPGNYTLDVLPGEPGTVAVREVMSNGIQSLVNVFITLAPPAGSNGGSKGR